MSAELEGLTEALNAIDLRLRLAAAEDVETVCRLYGQLAEEQWVSPLPENLSENVARFLGGTPGGFILVVEHEGRVAGMAAVEYFPAIPEGGLQLYIDDIVVDKPLRGQGLGSLLLAGVRAIAERLDARMIHLHVREDNEAARHFYKCRGYHRDVDAVYFTTLP
jgi:ribosomal protein S18 acetylase RimI-like enzyme